MIKRMHVALNCSNLQKSLEFYQAFFGTEPAKVKDNYAKFELEDPALHFSLNVHPFEKKGVLNHLGFQVNDTKEMLEIGERLRQSGLLLIDEMNTTCCYAVQDKVWVYYYSLRLHIVLLCDSNHISKPKQAPINRFVSLIEPIF
ncbi:VOC family protein [Paenibacillus frigoriresistens]|uniref:ArsI/CadI family heavy metal resistance metalloenzyme n=1 Tax=Paenibacillus alginolyticus TaxID=59839 RepID=UPI0015639F9A|nr:ArsI/CadI family heavy metal resistance metalloenzyme [Paenibacillus frigoriresistens]NRF96049.1 VOC family protein [Paenibacillus frigoriresistens]